MEPGLVRGTLMRGWEIARALRTPFQRAAMVMFVLTEVHPFADGNGRIARAFYGTAVGDLVAANAMAVPEPGARLRIPRTAL